MGVNDRLDAALARYQRAMARYVKASQKLIEEKAAKGKGSEATYAEMRDIKREALRVHVTVLRLRADMIEENIRNDTGLADVEIPTHLPENL